MSELDSVRVAEVRESRQFCGRLEELCLLKEQLAKVISGGNVGVLLYAEAGQGKTALIDQFLAARPHRDELWVLRGSCERHPEPYNGIQSVVADFVRRLDKLPSHDRDRIRPQQPQSHFDALAKMFPAFNMWRADDVGDVCLTELRRRAVLTLRDLFVQLGNDRPVILFIDDFHQALIDSWRLLAELTASPNAPRMLWILAYREGELSDTVTKHMRSMWDGDRIDARPPNVLPLKLDGLTPEAGSALLRARAYGRGRRDLLHGVDEGAVVLKLNFRPKAIEEWVKKEINSLSASTRMDGFRAHVINNLDRDTWGLLERLVVAGRSVEFDIVRRWKVDDEQLKRLLSELRAAGLISYPRKPASTVVIADEGVGEIVEAKFGDTAHVSALHRELAKAYEDHYEVNPDETIDHRLLAEHYAKAGQTDKAIGSYEKAACHAAARYSFDVAIEMYGRARALASRSDVESGRLNQIERDLAELQMDIGYAEEAAKTWERLAQDLPEDYEDERLQCRCLAKAQRIKSGEVKWLEDESYRADLARLDIHLPKRRFRKRGRIFRNHYFNKKIPPFTAREVDERTKQHLRVLLEATLAAFFEDTIHTSTLAPELLRKSCEAGDTYCYAWSLYIGVTYDASVQRYDLANQAITELRRVSPSSDQSELSGLREHSLAALHYLQLDWDRGDSQLDTALNSTADSGRRLEWLHRHMYGTLAFMRIQAGRFDRVRDEIGSWLTKAEYRNNRYEVTFLAAATSLMELYCGDPERATRFIQRAKPRALPDFYGYAEAMIDTATIAIALYGDDLDEADRSSREALRRARKQWLHRNPLVGVTLLELRGRCHVLRACRVRDQGWLQGWWAKRQALRCAGRLRADYRRVPAALAHAEILDAGVATLDGEVERAREHWRRARELLSDIGWEGLIAAIDVRLAESGADGEVGLPDRAREYFEHQGIRKPATFVKVLVPAAWTSSRLMLPSPNEPASS